MGRQAAYRRYCWSCWWLGRVLRGALTGTFASANNWSGILGATLVGLALRYYGATVMPGVSLIDDLAVALLYLATAWVVIFLARLVYVATNPYRDGQWYGSKFVYREPKLAFHALMAPEANNHVFAFKFRDAPPFSFIEYKYALDAPSDFMSLVVMSHPNQWPDFKSESDMQYTRGGMTVGKDRWLYFKGYLKPNSVPFSIRIYVTGWEDRIGRPDSKPDYRLSEFEPARWG